VSLRGAAMVLLAVAGVAACGVKAPPRPPEKAGAGAVPAAGPSSCAEGCGPASSTSTTTSTGKP
jgi:hypothetical protein